MKEYIKIAGAVILPNIGGLVGSKVSHGSINTWYKQLNFPSYRPPNWLFAPVWTALYSGMGYASYLVYKEGGGFSGDAKLPLIAYGTQLALNWAWTPIFFGQKKIKWGLVDLIALTATASATTALFFKVNNTAGYIMVPYLAWLCFATMLNYSMHKLNPEAIEEAPKKPQ